MESFVATRFLQELVNKELKQEFICSVYHAIFPKFTNLAPPQRIRFQKCLLFLWDH